MRSTIRLPADVVEFTEIVNGKSDLTRRRFRIRRGLGDVRVYSRLPRVHCIEQRRDSDEPLRREQSRRAEELKKVGDENDGEVVRVST